MKKKESKPLDGIGIPNKIALHNDVEKEGNVIKIIIYKKYF